MLTHPSSRTLSYVSEIQLKLIRLHRSARIIIADHQSLSRADVRHGWQSEASKTRSLNARIVAVPYVGNSRTEEAEKRPNGKVTYRRNSVAAAVAHVYENHV